VQHRPRAQGSGRATGGACDDARRAGRPIEALLPIQHQDYGWTATTAQTPRWHHGISAALARRYGSRHRQGRLSSTALNSFGQPAVAAPSTAIGRISATAPHVQLKGKVRTRKLTRPPHVALPWNREPRDRMPGLPRRVRLSVQPPANAHGCLPDPADVFDLSQAR